MEEASDEQPSQAGPMQNDNGDNHDEEEEEDRARNEAAAMAEALGEDETEESLWDSVIRWNQAGVSFLQRLLFAQAASTFARAMRAVHEQSTMALIEEEGDLQNQVGDDDDATVDANAVRRMRVTFPTAITSLRPAATAHEHTGNNTEDRGVALEVVGQQQPTIPSVIPQQQQQEEPLEPEDADANSWPSPPPLRPPMEHWQQDDGHWSSSFHIYNKAAHISALSSHDAGTAEASTTNAEDVENAGRTHALDAADTGVEEEIAGPNVEGEDILSQNNEDHPTEGDNDNNDNASEENQELQNQAQVQAQPPRLRTNNDNFTLAYVSAALLYNAGLVQHLKGLAAPTTTTTTNHPTVTTTAQRETAVSLQPVSYQKSLQLYQMGARTLQNCFEQQQQLQHQEQQDVETPPNEHLQEAPHEHEQRRRHVFYKQCQLLYLALINNMAHIYLHFSNRAAHNQCCNVLRGVLASRPTNELPQQQDDEQQFFVLNLIASQNLERQAAATA